MSENAVPVDIITNVTRTADGSIDTIEQFAVQRIPTDIQGAWFQPPYTTVKWTDGTTTTVKCDAEDAYDPKTGVLLCFAKRLFAGGRYNDALKKALGMVPEGLDTTFATVAVGGYEYSLNHDGTVCLVADYVGDAR